MTATKQQQAPNILIVDDTPANVLLLVRMLTERGYKARTALSGKLALEAARTEPPDLILLDITMPEMNGYEVCAQLKADAALKEIPVIFISALNETIDKVKAFSVGAVDYVTKPFQFEEVYARVQTHLQLRRLEKLRDDLTHMVVHDLRNPLTVICGFLDILELDEAQKLSASTQTLVTVARRSAADLLNMIGSILDVSKMGAGEMKLQREPCHLNALIRDLLATTQTLPGNRTMTLDAPESALSLTRAAARRVDELCRIDSSLEILREHLKAADLSLQEVSYALRDYLGRLEGNPGRLEEVETRLAAIDKLKRKYGQSIAEVLSFLDEVRRQIAAYIDTAVQDRRRRTGLDPDVALSDHRPDPERSAIERENLDLAMRVLNAVPKRDREVLVRFYLREEHPDLICREMELTETQFRLIKSRAKARFGELGRTRLASRTRFRP